jgi:hypothetical protein
VLGSSICGVSFNIRNPEDAHATLGPAKDWKLAPIGKQAHLLRRTVQNASDIPGQAKLFSCSHCGKPPRLKLTDVETRR